ncbi:MAG TPA: VWA domain-containing protein [Streptosporangiaceae bacterium]|nr:VWA domain-containing protein [Streptosporangiaceae bacterium]
MSTRAGPAGRAGWLGFPFSAVVGMDELRLALTLNAVSPAVGGVLVRGEKGTAKSTMVRALAAVLPEVDVVAGCRFSCDPAHPGPGCPDGPHEPGAAGHTRPARLVELPVGASEDRLTGALDIERALTEGVKAYEPGLLAAANRGVLYVDEVNLLHDHLVDLLLDAAALGTCYVERDGVSVQHAARFLLVGTMNPEEGELRPQLLDRFGLTAQAAAPKDPAQRAEVIRRRLAYESDPHTFAAQWAAAEAALADRIAQARRLLPKVGLPEEALHQIASVCAAFGVDGLRADLVIARASVAHAAWEGRTEVTDSDIRAAAALALPHRRRRQPFDPPTLDPADLDRALDQARQDAQPEPSPQTTPADDDPDPDDRGPDDQGPGSGQPMPGDERPTSAGPPMPSPATAGADAAEEPGQAGEPRNTSGKGAAPVSEPAVPFPAARVKRLEVPGIGTGSPGRRSRARTETGRVTTARIPRGRPTAIHAPATLMAAAPHQVARGRGEGPGLSNGHGPSGHRRGLVLRREDLREPHREGRESNLILFVVDASGSMAARSRMGAVKGAVLSLLLDAYQRRDKVGLITFRGSRADVLLPPTSSVEAAVPRLTALPTGGRTPLAAGLLRAHDMLRTERLRDPRRRPLLVLVTDGRATDATTGCVGTAGGAPPGAGAAAAAAHQAAALLASTGVAAIVVDCESGPVRLGLAAELAATLRCPALRLAELAAGPLADTVRALRGGFHHSEEVA